VNVVRAGPGLGTIQPSQSDYFQAVKGGGHGDYKLIVLAPSTVQEMVDHVKLGFELAFKWRNPVMILTDGALGQMMEKVNSFLISPEPMRFTIGQLVGKPKTRERNIITSLNIQPEKMQEVNLHLQRKYREIENEEIRYEIENCEDADVVLVAFGLVARICKKAADLAKEKGINVGVFRPITVFPYPYEALNQLADKSKLFLTVEMNAGQMLEDVKLAINGKAQVEFIGRMGGIIPTPEEILNKIEEIYAGVTV
jgi:2-oxoglutarate ferredoxin oxidoreductase subunit alpha